MTTEKDYLQEERSKEWREALRKQMKAKERTAIERVRMPEQDPEKRNKNNSEVNMGLSETDAVKEARRCLDCVDPTCISGVR